jgi:hypothetical protein
MNREEAAPDSEYEKLKNSKFKQQKIPAWRPVPTIRSTMFTFLFFGMAFIGLGAAVLVYSNDVVEENIRYSEDGDCLKGENSIKICTFDVQKDMEAPIMVFYQLDGFYQNHRRFVKSKSDLQLSGVDLPLDNLTKLGVCDPIIQNKDTGRNVSYDGTPLNEAAPANPCGLIAKSYFNDTYKLYSGDYVKTEIKIDETGIAWQADREWKYKHAQNPNGEKDEKYWEKIQWIDVENEHFIVWMRPSGLQNFRKLWGRIRSNITAGTKLTLEISNNYPVDRLNGSKYFVLSTVNSFGGKNNFLGISYIIVGSICIVMAIAFVLGYKIHQAQNNN